VVSGDHNRKKRVGSAKNCHQHHLWAPFRGFSIVNNIPFFLSPEERVSCVLKSKICDPYSQRSLFINNQSLKDNSLLPEEWEGGFIMY
jgi:hypothetical protein